MLDDAHRTRRTDDASTPRLADYVIVTALVAVAAIATYRLFDRGAVELTADVRSGEHRPAGDAVPR